MRACKRETLMLSVCTQVRVTYFAIDGAQELINVFRPIFVLLGFPVVRYRLQWVERNFSHSGEIHSLFQMKKVFLKFEQIVIAKN